MDFTFSPEDEAFRKDVADWIQANLPKGWGTPEFDMPKTEEEEFAFRMAWQRTLATKGFVAAGWPKEYGGGGYSHTQQVIIDEELARAQAPQIGNVIALGFCGPTILVCGTEEQKKRFVPKMITGEEIWCEGFSEPDAGSDLASLKANAVIDGDDYVINGQKVWSSIAHHADWQILLVRTDTKVAPKHRGITFLLVDMKTPGIEVRPLRQITGDAEFNEVFYDNVRVPRSNVVGEENRGWYIAMTTLSLERTGTVAGISFKQALDSLVEIAKRTMRNGKPAIDDPAIRGKLAQLAIDVQIVVLNSYRTLSTSLKGQVPGPEAQTEKIFWSEMNQRLTELAANILGADVLLGGSNELRRWQHEFLRAKGNTIEMGTSEILRNVIGERVLGLPR